MTGTGMNMDRVQITPGTPTSSGTANSSRSREIAVPQGEPRRPSSGGPWRFLGNIPANPTNLPCHGKACAQGGQDEIQEGQNEAHDSQDEAQNLQDEAKLFTSEMYLLRT